MRNIGRDREANECVSSHAKNPLSLFTKPVQPLWVCQGQIDIGKAGLCSRVGTELLEEAALHSKAPCVHLSSQSKLASCPGRTAAGTQLPCGQVTGFDAVSRAVGHVHLGVTVRSD